MSHTHYNNLLGKRCKSSWSCLRIRASDKAGNVFAISNFFLIKFLAAHFFLDKWTLLLFQNSWKVGELPVEVFVNWYLALRGQLLLLEWMEFLWRYIFRKMLWLIFSGVCFSPKLKDCFYTIMNKWVI